MPTENITTNVQPSSIVQYSPIYFLIVLIIILKYDYFKINVIDRIDNNVIFIGLLSLTIMTIIYFIIKSKNDNYQNPNNLYVIIFSFIFLIFLIIFKISSFQFFIIKMLIYVFLGLIIIILLSIIYQVSNTYLQKQSGWFGFIIKFIFYIPCLFNDFIKFILDEYNSTSTLIFTLFILEIIAILSYFYFPKIINQFMNLYSVNMLKYPVQLNKETILKFPSNIYNYKDRIDTLTKNVNNNMIQINDTLNNKIIEVKSDSDSINSKILEIQGLMKSSNCNQACKDNYTNIINQLNGYNTMISSEINRITSSVLLNGGIDYPIQKTQNYSISLWVNLNTQSSSRIKKDTPTNIFKFASSSDAASGHPMIAYSNNEVINEKKEDSYVIYMEDGNGRTHEQMVGDDAIFTISLPSQKWHNFVFTYTDNKVNLFINGVLEKVHTFSDSQKTNVISVDDNMYIGTSDVGDNLYNYGAYGAVCNVVFYNIPLELSTIIYNYNLSVINNPPYIE